jgi:peptidoglycan L-alanyl-D-glutamate endopeptidase CwlK
MARYWGPKSRRVYDQLNTSLQVVVDFILLEVSDVSLITGHRDEATQNQLYPTFTKVRWPDSKHNKTPAEAVDLQPFPYPEVEQELREQLSYIAGRAIQYANQLHITLRWGGDWNRNGSIVDNTFDDLFHFEVLHVESTSVRPTDDDPDSGFYRGYN